jgi:hypothetical protein
MAKNGQNTDLNVYEPPVAYQHAILQATGSRFAGYGIYAGENRPFGGMITYYLKSLKSDTVEINGEKEVKELEKDSLWVEIYNDSDEMIRQMKVGARKGFNRFSWDLRRKGVRYPSTPKPKAKDTSDFVGPNVLPGEYKIKILYGDFVDSTLITVKLDPRMEYNTTALKTMDARTDKVMELVTSVTKSVDQLNEIKNSIDLIEKMLTEDEVSKEIKERTKMAKDTIKYFIELINGPEEVQGIQRDPELVSSKLSTLNYYISTAVDMPNQSHEILIAQAEKAAKDVQDKINTWIDEDWANTKKIIEKAQLSPFKETENEE